MHRTLIQSSECDDSIADFVWVCKIGTDSDKRNKLLGVLHGYLGDEKRVQQSICDKD